MREPDFPEVRRGRLPKADDLNRAFSAVASASDFSTLFGQTGPDGHQVVTPDTGWFTIELTEELAPDGPGKPYRYSWEIVLHDTDAVRVPSYATPYTGTMDGVFAAEADGQRAAVGDICRAWHGDGEYLLFVKIGARASGSGSGPQEGACCNSGVLLRRFRCNAGRLQYTNVCTRKEGGTYLLRDEQCRVMLGECGCSPGSVMVLEYDFDPSLDNPLVVTRLSLSEECGTLVLRVYDSQNCDAMPERAVCGTGVKIRTLECQHGAIVQTWVYLTLECGKIKKRTSACVAVDELCCDQPTNCIRTSDGPTWHDSGCACVIAGCQFPGNAGGFPDLIDWVAFGIASTGCEGTSCSGTASWTNDSVGLGFWPFGPPVGIPNPAGYVFNYTCGGVHFHYLWYCVGLNPDAPSNPRWGVTYWTDGAGVPDGPCRPPMALIQPWGNDGDSDPGHGEFSQDLGAGGGSPSCPCNGGLYFITATAS